ncbi:MAG: RNA-binding cell elongation regulator Jag/EloR [Desulfobacteraceae bacterium]
MNQFVEFEGKNIDQALARASDELGTPVERLEYDVVSYGSSGIFGLVGAKKAKIRVKSKKLMGFAKETRQQARDLVKDAFQLDDESAKPESDAEVSGLRGNEKQEDDGEEDKGPPKISEADMEKVIATGREALRRMVDFITEDSQIDVETTGQRVLFKVEGGNSAMLIGKRGQTLEAIQYLVEKIVNKQNEQRIRVLIDVEGYLKTRKSNLQKLASKMADKAQKTKKPVTIGQMNAYDRRTVHLHLKNNSGVRTQSVGEGYYRKLIIFPKKGKRGRQYN